jgi:hypothetical protein
MAIMVPWALEPLMDEVCVHVKYILDSERTKKANEEWFINLYIKYTG